VVDGARREPVVTSTAAPRPRKLGHLARRVASGAVLAAIVFASIATVPSFAAVLLAVSLVSLHEFAGLAERTGRPLVYPVAAAAVATYLVLTAAGVQHRYGGAVLAVTTIVTLAVALAGPRAGYLARCASTLFGVLYLGWLGSYFLALRNRPHVGAAYTAECIAAIALTDIFAMVVGSSIGRTPMTSISPGKTWEGACGGFAATVLATSAFGAFAGLGLGTWWQGAIVGALTSVGAQVGDVVESAFKRDARVKDAGTILPGHGGILDRFDSYTFGGIAFYAGLFVTGHIAR